MGNRIRKGEVKVQGIDIAKQSFQFHGVDEGGHVFRELLNGLYDGVKHLEKRIL